MEDIKLSVTPSLVIEYMYCPRFVYFMKAMNINQNEEKRFKVNEGREVHKYKSLTNKDYLRKKIGVIKKEVEQNLYSDKYNINGKIDEILFLNDNTASPLDYKYAEFKDKVFETYKIQSIMYCMLIEDNYKIQSKKGYIVYTRSKNYIEELIFSEKDFQEIKIIINEILDIINKGYFPDTKISKNKCDDCCYKNIC